MIDDRAQFYAEVKGWLIECLDLDEVDFAIRSDARVVERWRQKWRDFKTQFQGGDELWSFNSPQERWNGLAGRAGYALVRQGNVVDAVCTLVS